MVTTPIKLTFEDFLEQYPDGYGIYELVNGEIVNSVNYVRYYSGNTDRLDKLFQVHLGRSLLA